MFHSRTHIQRTDKAFTLIEVMVAVSIFAMVMLVSTGAVFSIVEANKKAHSIKSVMTNLNFALESMSRDIRVGSGYDCVPSTLSVTDDCPFTPGDSFMYRANKDVNGDGNFDSNDKIIFSKSGTGIVKQVLGSTAIPITASEINVTNLKFYVSGAASPGGAQPKLTMIIQGYSGAGKTRSEFNIQTTVSQRASDS